MKQFRTPYLFRWIFYRRIWGFSRHKRAVYITFDDGPTPDCTQWILNLLDSYNAKATFFCVGSNAKDHPELLQEIIQKGHAIGNHTMRHEKGTVTDRNAYLESVKEASQYINSSLFRPPYGRVPMHFTKAIRKEYQIIMWTWLSYDYDKDVTPEEILERAKSIKEGDILVLHDNLKSFEKLQLVLPGLLEMLQEKGYELKAISA